MGSDDGDKKNRKRPYYYLLSAGRCGAVSATRIRSLVTSDDAPPFHSETQRASARAFRLLRWALVATFLLFLIVLCLLPPPEILFSPTFTASEARYPTHCQAAASDFFRCQQQTQQSFPAAVNASAGSSRTLVLACHRRWCNSWGFCEPCNGLGDRMRFLLSQVHEAAAPAAGGGNGNCVRIQLDYPVQDVAVLDSALYVDPAGWWGHLIRRRSYLHGKIFHKERLVEPAGGSHDRSTSIPHDHHHLRFPGSFLREPSLPHEEITVSHFVPDGYNAKEYNPCYFHFLFQPTPSLQADIDRHCQALTYRYRQNQQGEEEAEDGILSAARGQRHLPSIGIHFRTGDVTAFGRIEQNDTRVGSGDLTAAWDQMLHCADQLARKLFPNHHETVPYFVATDNQQLKERIHSEYGLASSSSSSSSSSPLSSRRKRFVYTTDITPQSTWKAWAGDRDAWMELYLLSMQAGLVVNVRPRNYGGPAGRTSFFSVLARKVAFMDTSHVHECILD